MCCVLCVVVSGPTNRSGLECVLTGGVTSRDVTVIAIDTVLPPLLVLLAVWSCCYTAACCCCCSRWFNCTHRWETNCCVEYQVLGHQRWIDFAGETTSVTIRVGTPVCTRYSSLYHFLLKLVSTTCLRSQAARQKAHSNYNEINRRHRHRHKISTSYQHYSCANSTGLAVYSYYMV